MQCSVELHSTTSSIVCGFNPLYPTILVNLNEKLRPPLPPLRWWNKWPVLVLVRVRHWVGGRVSFISYFIPTKIVDWSECTGLQIKQSNFDHWAGSLLCSRARYNGTKWVPLNQMLWEWPCNGLASHPVGNRNTPRCSMLEKPEILVYC